MRSLLALLVFVALCTPAFSQTYSIKGIVVDSVTGDSLYGVRLKLMAADSLIKGTLSKVDGSFQLTNVPGGQYVLIVTSGAFEEYKRNIVLDRDSISLLILLHPKTTANKEIVVSGTRTERSIEDVPVRVEVVSQEDVEEKIMEKPSNVVELLNESVGTRTQNTSATSNAANIRIQGLDGRYTQVLVDGIPSYTGLASNLGLTQLMPLNLQRVEIVKGASSALYGPDAIAGLINFITKDPKPIPEVTAIVNATNQQGYDGAAYYGQQFDKFGSTMLVAYSKQTMFDVDGDLFSDIPAQERLELSPKIKYLFTDSVTGVASATFLKEERLGGVMGSTEADIGKAAPWVESNKSTRYDLSASMAWAISDVRSLIVRSSAMHYLRDSYFGTSPFDGTQDFRFLDAQYQFPFGLNSLLIGSSYQRDAFQDRTPTIPASRSYSYGDLAGWLQDDIRFSPQWEALAVARIDQHDPFGTFFTPRASLMFKPSASVSMRVGAGTGFKAPTIFLEDAELHGYSNLRPLSNVIAEQARSGSFDIDVHAPIGSIAAKCDLALFATDFEHALVLNDDSLASNILFIQNATGPTISKGLEGTVDISLEDVRLTTSYAYLDVRQTNNGQTYLLELNPAHWLGLTLSYEDDEDGWKVGTEFYYIGTQRVDRDPFRTITPSYWNGGVLIDKAFGVIHVYLNSENIFDVRQSKYEPTYLGDPMIGVYHPLPLWAPLEGRTINGGVRFVWPQ